MIVPGVKLITFDATNTLLKFRTAPWEHYTAVAKQHGYTTTKDRVKAEFLESFKKTSKAHPNYGKNSIKWENWWRQVVQSTFQHCIPRSKVNVIANTLIEDFTTSKCWCPAKGSYELLEYLHKKDFCLGVISNFDPRLHQILNSLNMRSYFNFIITSYEIGYSKPDRLIFDSAIEKTKSNIMPFECLHIGDDLEKDYIGATAAGWHAILVTEKVKDDKYLNHTKNTHYNVLYNNLEELTPL